jgi:hypothetical protein
MNDVYGLMLPIFMTRYLCYFSLLQLGEEQLKSLLERVSEKTAKTTTVKVSISELVPR